MLEEENICGKEGKRKSKDVRETKLHRNNKDRTKALERNENGAVILKRTKEERYRDKENSKYRTLITWERGKRGRQDVREALEGKKMEQ